MVVGFSSLTISVALPQPSLANVNAAASSFIEVPILGGVVPFGRFVLCTSHKDEKCENLGFIIKIEASFVSTIHLTINIYRCRHTHKHSRTVDVCVPDCHFLESSS
jgi:hypothetical protein